MAGPAQRIDAALGRGWYGQWQSLERRRQTAVRELDNYSRKLAGLKAEDAAERFTKDSWYMAKLARDYRQGLELIGQGKWLDPDEVGQIHDLYTMALGVVELDVEICQAWFAGGIVIGLVALPMAVFQQRARKLKRALSILEAELKRARRECREAEAQLVINTALTAISFAAPGLSVLAQGAIFAGQIVSDQLLGPESAVQHAGASTAVQGVAAFADATEKVEALRTSAAGRFIRSRTFSAGAAFLGIHGDASEVFASYRYRDKVRAALREAEKAYEELMGQIRRYKPRLKSLQLFVKRWTALMAGKRATAAKLRKMLEADMRRINYPSGFLPYKWRSLSAPAVRAGAGRTAPAATRRVTG